MVVSLVLGFLAMFVATMGMKCTRCGGDDKVKKARIAMGGGIIFIVAGEPQGSPIWDERGWARCPFGDPLYQNPHSLSRSCRLDSLLLVWPSDCHRLL